MKKLIIGFLIILFLGGGIYLFITSQNKETSIKTSENPQPTLTSPSRAAEINGYILSIEGNEITVANEIGIKEISDEERARRQKMTQEERQALRAQESANLKKENITLTIPVGVSIVKGTGNATGENTKTDMTALVKGVYVSIWTSGNNVEFVKLKGVSSQ